MGEGDADVRPSRGARVGGRASGRVPGRAPGRAATIQKWTRTVHVYTSMAALLVVLFFGITGVTLNHPDWTFGLAPTTSATTGALPAGAVRGTAVDFLAVSEHLRKELHVRGEVSDYGVTGGEAFISYRGPGYVADVRIDVAAATFSAAVEEQGAVGVLNDLHKGRNTATSWSWLIDVAGAFLVAISATGIVLQLLLRRRRTSAVLVAAGGAVGVVVLALLTVR